MECQKGLEPPSIGRLFFIISFYETLFYIIVYYCLILHCLLSIVCFCLLFVYFFVCCFVFFLFTIVYIDCCFIIMNPGSSSITDLPKIVRSSRGRSSLSFATSGPAGIYVFKLNPLQKSDLLSLRLINKALVWRLKIVNVGILPLNGKFPLF